MERRKRKDKYDEHFPERHSISANTHLALSLYRVMMKLCGSKRKTIFQ